MKLFAKLIGVLLSVLILTNTLTAMPFWVNAANKSGDTGECIWILHGNELTISGKGTMQDYSICDRAPWGTGIKKVVIKNGVKNIGNYAFYDCEILKSAILPESAVSIGDYAFHYCQSLTSVIIPRSMMNIGYNTFSYCQNLASVTFLGSVISIGDEAFEECALTEITLPRSIVYLGKRSFGYNVGEGFIGMPIQGFIIRSKIDTVAQLYAEINGFIFVPLYTSPFFRPPNL